MSFFFCWFFLRLSSPGTSHSLAPLIPWRLSFPGASHSLAPLIPWRFWWGRKVMLLNGIRTNTPACACNIMMVLCIQRNGTSTTRVQEGDYIQVQLPWSKYSTDHRAIQPCCKFWTLRAMQDHQGRVQNAWDAPDVSRTAASGTLVSKEWQRSLLSLCAIHSPDVR